MLEAGLVGRPGQLEGGGGPRPAPRPTPLTPPPPRPACPPAGTQRRRDAPFILLPHQNDYIGHIALDIGAGILAGLGGAGGQSGAGPARAGVRMPRPAAPSAPLGCGGSRVARRRPLPGGSLIKLVYFTKDCDEDKGGAQRGPGRARAGGLPPFAAMACLTRLA